MKLQFYSNKFLNLQILLKRKQLHLEFMDIYQAINDIDMAFIYQNSWLIILEKQLLRNGYLFKKYELNDKNKKNKHSQKDLLCRIKSSISRNISQKIKKRKDYQRSTNLMDGNSISLNVRRKTEEIPRLMFQKNIQRNSSNYISINKRNSIKKTFQIKKLRYFQIEQTSQNCALPFDKSSISANQFLNFEKKSSRKIVENYYIASRQSKKEKNISSLQDLQFDSKQYSPTFHSKELQLRGGYSYNKKLNNIKEILVRSSFNSPDKKQQPIIDFKQVKSDKKPALQLPEISKLSSRKLTSNQFIKKINNMEFNPKEKQNKSELIKERKPSQSKQKKTQETKESQTENTYDLQSLIDYYMKSQRKQQVFQDNHISKNNSIRAYRISRINNVKFPVF